MSNARPAPAFPLCITGDFESYEEGMSLRDYFAARAMAAWLPIHWELGKKDDDFSAKEVAMDAFILADAMLEARERKEAKP